jgi:hypothetical protein
MGLNNAEIAFHKIDERQTVAGADWLAIFPAWFQGSAIMADIRIGFEPRVEIRVPMKEYTVCNNPGQTVVVIFERKGLGRNTSNVP